MPANHAAIPNAEAAQAFSSNRSTPHPLTVHVTVMHDLPRSDAWRALWRRLLAPVPTDLTDAAAPAPTGGDAA